MISVVLTVYNTSLFLHKSILSILNSSFKDFELIIVEDCSTDNSLQIAKSFKDSRIRIIRHPENLGAGYSRKHGIEYAKGDYIITIDSDDTISESFLEDLYNTAITTKADIVSGGITVIKDEVKDIINYKNKCSEGMLKFKDYANGKIIFLNNKLVSRKLYNLVPYCTRRYIEDTPVIMKLLYYANKIAYCSNTGYYYNLRECSLTQSASKYKQTLYTLICLCELRSFFQTKENEFKEIIPIDLIGVYLHRLSKFKPTLEEIELYGSVIMQLFQWVLIHMNELKPLLKNDK